MEPIDKVLDITQKHNGESLKTASPSPSPTPTASFLISKIKEIIKTPCKSFKPPTIKFELSEKAAAFNSKLLHAVNFDTERLISSQGDTILTPGSEFRDVSFLDSLLSKFHRWPKLKLIIQQGASYPLLPHSDLDEETKQKDIIGAMKQGNNLSAKSSENKPILLSHYKKEVEKGWMIPFLREDVPKLKDAGVIPAGIAEQHSINEKGETIEKKRVTHDGSRPRLSGTSVNSLCDKSKLDPAIFAFALFRILHMVHILRIRNPFAPILLGKYDLDAAYRRIHARHKEARQCITIIDRIAYLLTRLPFGTTPAADCFTTASEVVTDLAQLIAEDDSWDPLDLHSPLADEVPEADLPSSEVNLEIKPLPLIKDLEPKNIYHDVYIDDIVSVVLAYTKYILRARQAAPLAIHSIFRPLDKLEAVIRDHVLCIRKLFGEGKLSEIKAVFGWIINTREFTVSLSDDKHRNYSKIIKDMLSSYKKIKEEDLESLIGKINHAAFVIPLLRYFLTRLRYRLKCIKTKGSQLLHKWDREDLKLILKFLGKANKKGIRIDHITFTFPDYFTISDASKFGMGGFTSEGFAWRYKIPDHLLGIFSINILEFIAAIITISLSLLTYWGQRMIPMASKYVAFLTT